MALFWQRGRLCNDRTGFSMTKKGYCAACIYVVRQLQVHLNLANCASGGGCLQMRSVP